MAHGEAAESVEGAGRSLAAPGRFTSDDGSPDLSIRDAADQISLTAALREGRVIVAVVAIADETSEVSGVTVDKTSEMSIVSMIAKDGRRGLLAFTGIDALRAWDPSARPVPVSGVDAARAALDDHCEAIVLDVAGPRMQVVSETDLVGLANVDARDYARDLVERLLNEKFGDGQVHVLCVGERLQVRSITGDIDGGELARCITPRVLALVPAGVEIHEG